MQSKKKEVSEKQIAMDILEKHFGEVIPVDQIWAIFKVNKYDIRKAAENLAEKSGKTVEMSLFVQPVKKSKKVEPKEEDDQERPNRRRTSEEVYNKIKVFRIISGILI